jgi:conjugative transfer region protein TrbK
MSSRVTPRLARLAALAIALLAVAVTVVQIRRGDGLPPATSPSPATTAEPLAEELAHCRTITSGELTADQACERAWAENRRRFFAPGESPPRTPQLEMFPGLPAGVTKDHDRAPGPGVGPGGVP